MPHALSPTEYDAIKAHVLASAPDGLSEADFTRYVKPAFEQALGEAESSPAPVTGSAAARFVAGAWKNLNPMGAVKALTDPAGAVEGIGSAMKAQYATATDLYKQGRYVEAAGHFAASAIPMIGPAAAQAGESIAEGDIAGGLGQGVGLEGAALVPRALIKGRVPIGRATSAVGKAVTTIGESPAAQYGAGAGAYHAAMRGSLPEAALAVTAPSALRGAGRGLTRAGEAISGKGGTAAVPRTALQTAIDQAVSEGKLRRMPGWTPESGPVIRAPKPMIEPPAAAPPAAPEAAPAAAPVAAQAPAAPVTPTPPPAEAVPARTVTPIAKFNPSEAMTSVRQAFSALKNAPQRGELSNAIEFVRRGFTAEEAVGKVIDKRPAVPKSAAETLAKKLGTPSTDEVEATVRARNTTGKWD